MEYISVAAVTAAYGIALTYGPSLRLGVPSLRYSSGGIARLSPNKHQNEACRGGGWIKIKSC
ncbi:hypothetical protein PMI34_04287, partial [Pseudomonas sp. GM74]